MTAGGLRIKVVNGTNGLGRYAFEGESSFLTRFSSSFSESESRTTTLPGGRSGVADCACATFGGEAELFADTALPFAAESRRFASNHAVDPYLLSAVCHSPSGSTSTSSTESGVDLRIRSKYLRSRLGNC